MAVAIRSVGVSPGDSSETCVIVKPVGLSVGDLMISHIEWQNDNLVVTPPADWTEIRIDTGSFQGAVLFWKIADQDDVDASNFTFTGNDSRANIGAISAWTGHNPDTPINADNGQQNSYSSEATSPEITPSVANCMICMFVGISNDLTSDNYSIAISNPASWTEAYDLMTKEGTDCACAMGLALRPETSATGNGTADLSGSSTNQGQLVAIAPAEAPPEEEIRYIPHCGPRKKRTQWLGTMRT